MKKIIIFLSLLTIAKLSFADTQFIKYRGINIPLVVVGEQDEELDPADSEIVLDFGENSISNRTDEGATFLGTLVSGFEADTWFIIEEEVSPEFPPNTTSTGSVAVLGNSPEPLPLTNADCSTQRQNQQRLSAGQSNEYTLAGLDANTTYNIGFCAVGLNGDVLGGVITFSTKRNESTTVNYSCVDNLRFNAADGPLEIVVDAEGVNTDRDANLAIINVNNSLGITESDIRITPDRSVSNNGILEGEVLRRTNATYGIPANRVSGGTFNVDTNEIQSTPSEYRVELSDDSNWTATFSCSELNCAGNIPPSQCRNFTNNLRVIAQ